MFSVKTKIFSFLYIYIGKIGYVPLKEPMFGYIPSKELVVDIYH